MITDMKMTKVKHFTHALLEAAYKCAGSRLSAQLNQCPTIVKTDFQGSDMKLWLGDGRVLMISAIESENTGKPVLEFEISSELTKPEAVV
jgi:hypothetical protein